LARLCVLRTAMSTKEVFFVVLFIIIMIMMLLSPVTSLFSPVLLLNQWRPPPLRLHFSDCSTFRIMCDVTWCRANFRSPASKSGQFLVVSTAPCNWERWTDDLSQ
jgi:hypothetical protein